MKFSIEQIRQRFKDLNYRPYLDMGVILFLENILTKEMSVLETGSGASTIWFAERVKEVVTFENSLLWYYVLKDIIRERGLKNITVIFDKEYPTKRFSEFKGEFDIVFLDGIMGAENRNACIKTGWKNVKSGGFLIIDDTHLEKDLKEGLEILDALSWDKLEFEGQDIYGEEKTTIIYRNQKVVKRNFNG